MTTHATSAPRAARIETRHTGGNPDIAYDVCGSGDTVVFLHGIGGNRTNWRDQLEALAPYYRAVAWDARGYGDSADYDGPLDFDLFNADLLRLLDHLDVRRAILVGLSMGGRIVQHFYRHHPDRVKAVVLCDTIDRPDDDPAYRARFLADRKAPLLAGKSPKDIAPRLAAALASSAPQPQHMQRLVDSMSALRTASYLKALDALAAQDEIARLPDFAVPVLLVYGDEDRLTTPQVGRDLARRIEGSEFRLIEKAGHLSNIENPQQFNAAVLDFLERRLVTA